MMFAKVLALFPHFGEIVNFQNLHSLLVAQLYRTCKGRLAATDLKIYRVLPAFSLFMGGKSTS